MFDSATSASTFRDTFRGRVNTGHDRIYSNIRKNIRRQLPQVQPHPPSKYKVALICGGWSLAQSERQIRALWHKGWKIFTVNGTHQWVLERDMLPSLHAQLDARPFNVRFVSQPSQNCRYLICSQCDPSVFDALALNDVHIWHGESKTNGDAGGKLLNRFYKKRWHPVMGGSSIGTRAVGLAYILGIRELRIFGQDGCLIENKHHAYDQPENDSGSIFRVRVGRRIFRCHAWMLNQLDEWLRMAPHIPDDIQISIEGDGMIAYVISETARIGRAPTILVEK